MTHLIFLRPFSLSEKHFSNDSKDTAPYSLATVTSVEACAHEM